MQFCGDYDSLTGNASVTGAGDRASSMGARLRALVGGPAAGEPASLAGGAWGFLGELLGEFGFQLVDIGARGGEFPPLRLLAPHSHYVACEPDAEHAATLEGRLRESAPWRSVTLVREAIAAREGQATLYVTNQPGMSSLIEPDERVMARYCEIGDYRLAAKVTVPTITLDQAAERYGFAGACLLKLDTQGSELEILRSGPRLVCGPLLGVHVEVEFQPMYRGQPLFAEVDEFLRGAGFTLFDVQRSLYRRAGCRKDRFSRRQVVWAHALYLREPEDVLAARGPGVLPAVCRLLGLALAFEHLDLALEIARADALAALLGSQRAARLVVALEAWIEARTRAVLARAGARQAHPDPLAHYYKDKNHLYD